MRYDAETNVVMCMDWMDLPEAERPANFQGQWEDDLGGVASAGKTAKNVYLLNKHFS